MATSATPGSDAFVSSLTSMVNREDTIAILRAQTHMLSRFEKTNETLSNFNKLSAVRYEKTIEQFKKHTQVLMDMKRDLDIVFRKIRYGDGGSVQIGTVAIATCMYEWAGPVCFIFEGHQGIFSLVKRTL